MQFSSQNVDLRKYTILFNKAEYNSKINRINNVVEFTVSPIEGVNYIIVEDYKKIIFQSRFLYGNKEENILLDKTNSFKQNIINSFNTYTINLNHKAYGAEKFRVLLKYNTKAAETNEIWSDWKVISKNHQILSISLDYWKNISLNNIYQIVVQYYADNSSCYYVYRDIKNVGFLGFS